MSGPVAMMLGPFAFEALGFGNTGFTKSLDTKWADVDVAQTFNRLQWTGPTSKEITISGVLFPESYGGQTQLDGISAMAEQGEPMMFVSGDANAGEIHGMWTVQSIEEEKSYLDRMGRARRNAYSIKLRYAPDAEGSDGEGGFDDAADLLSEIGVDDAVGLALELF